MVGVPIKNVIIFSCLCSLQRFEGAPLEGKEPSNGVLFPTLPFFGSNRRLAAHEAQEPIAADCLEKCPDAAALNEELKSLYSSGEAALAEKMMSNDPLTKVEPILFEMTHKTLEMVCTYPDAAKCMGANEDVCVTEGSTDPSMQLECLCNKCSDMKAPLARVITTWTISTQVAPMFAPMSEEEALEIMLKSMCPMSGSSCLKENNCEAVSNALMAEAAGLPDTSSVEIMLQHAPSQCASMGISTDPSSASEMQVFPDKSADGGDDEDDNDGPHFPLPGCFDVCPELKAAMEKSVASSSDSSEDRTEAQIMAEQEEQCGMIPIMSCVVDNIDACAPKEAQPMMTRQMSALKCMCEICPDMKYVNVHSSLKSQEMMKEQNKMSESDDVDWDEVDRITEQYNAQMQCPMLDLVPCLEAGGEACTLSIDTSNAKYTKEKCDEHGAPSLSDLKPVITTSGAAQSSSWIFTVAVVAAGIITAAHAA
eukprot:gnl/TRDRNA2_/TRDRNA2_166708_c4_seq1.p1 gnl/TRDRNA2_/TRDRNA2_166708_c4~~gnl/TRDRNA2_/TRDRNA2_166708_c4_seq1.p1  ORF type:complete len:501 (+),score=103.02 gnl/TRDRNA2_/TRDRNA2_166708_c4_seq1:65-1504(+)